jgi:hypothetical protein
VTRLSTCVRIGLAAALALAAAPVSAQYKGFFFTSPAEIGVTRETKFIVDNRELSDNVMLFALPTMSLLSLNPRGEFSLSYQPEIQAFGTYRELTAVNHQADLLYSQAVTPSLTISLGDNFIATSDPSRRVVDSVLLLPRERMMENQLYAQISRRFGHDTTFTIRYDNTVTLVDAAETTTRIGLMDRVTSSGSASLSQRVSRRHLLVGTYAFLDGRPLTTTPARTLPTGFVVLPAEPEQIHTAAGSYMYDGDSFSMRVGGGLVYGRDFTYTGGGQLDKRLGRTTLTVIAARNLSFFGGVMTAADPRFASGLLPFGLYESAIVRLTGEVSRKVSVEIQGVAQRTFSELTELDIRSDFARVKLEYRVTRAAALVALAEAYRQSFNEFVGTRLEWQRYGIGLELSVNRKPNPLEERRRMKEERERRLRRGEAVDDEEIEAPATRGVSGESTR